MGKIDNWRPTVPAARYVSDDDVIRISITAGRAKYHKCGQRVGVVV